uniref:Protein-tyrosine-phosphatase MKP1 C-terminal domain-containing protein n=1 Tax=Kalanchoe fedtschenkoi TaxID=63787 RepID=A0A7N0VK85_KALFE
MLGEDDGDKAPGGTPRKGYLRSVSWSDRSPSKPFSRPQGMGLSGSKQRSCLPPLQPLSISRRSVEEWPRAGSDDLGVWPNPPTPGGKMVPIKSLEIPEGEQRAQREFLFKKDKLAFFDKECSRIAEHIYLGSDAVAKNWEILKKNGITHVLNCVGFVCPEYFKNDLVYKTLWLQDSPSEDITSILYDVFDYFEDVREQKGRVLSPSLSPSTSDYASSFTFSPSSSNWSDHSGLCSRQPSPSGLESNPGFSPKDGSIAGANACLQCEDTPSIAERRPPPPMILPSVDKPPRVPRPLVRSSSFSLPDLEIGRRLPLEHDCSSDGQHQMLYEERSALGGGFRSEDSSDFTQSALHYWPSMAKMEMHRFDSLDSRSVYIMSALDPALDRNDCSLVYVWLGHEAGMENLTSSSDCRSSPVDGNICLEAIGHEFINSWGLPINSTVQVIKEGEEPQHFLDCLNLLTVRGKG